MGLERSILSLADRVVFVIVVVVAVVVDDVSFYFLVLPFLLCSVFVVVVVASLCHHIHGALFQHTRSTSSPPKSQHCFAPL